MNIQRIQSWSCLVLALVLLAGCSTRYDIRLRSGSVITTKGKPRLVGNYYVFTDMFGMTNRVNLLQVSAIAPRGETTDKQSYYISGKP